MQVILTNITKIHHEHNHQRRNLSRASKYIKKMNSLFQCLMVKNIYLYVFLIYSFKVKKVNTKIEQKFVFHFGIIYIFNEYYRRFPPKSTFPFT